MQQEQDNRTGGAEHVCRAKPLEALLCLCLSLCLPWRSCRPLLDGRAVGPRPTAGRHLEGADGPQGAARDRATSTGLEGRVARRQAHLEARGRRDREGLRAARRVPRRRRGAARRDRGAAHRRGEGGARLLPDPNPRARRHSLLLSSLLLPSLLLPSLRMPSLLLPPPVACSDGQAALRNVWQEDDADSEANQWRREEEEERRAGMEERERLKVRTPTRTRTLKAARASRNAHPSGRFEAEEEAERNRRKKFSPMTPAERKKQLEKKSAAAAKLAAEAAKKALLGDDDDDD
eukprot:5624104-Prymnesium_polylepis.1